MAANLTKELHDLVMSFKPEGATHPDDCPICSAVEDGTETPVGGDMSDTYTQEELDTAIAAAVKELQAKLELTETQETFAKEKEALEAKVEELQTELDKAVLAAEQAKSDQESVIAFLVKAEEDASQAEEAAKKKKARMEKMGAYAFAEEYLEAQADRWAAMSDEEFDAYVADIESVAKKVEATEETEEIPATTAMTATDTEKKTGSKSSLMHEIFTSKLRGVDLGTV